MKSNDLFPEFSKQFLGKKQALSWIEESFQEKNNNQESIVLGRVVDSKKLIFFLVFFFLFILFFLGRSFYLQIFKGNYYYNLAEGNRIKTVEIDNTRGLFYDRNGQQLVKNENNFILSIIPRDQPKDIFIAQKNLLWISNYLMLDFSAVKKQLKKYTSLYSQPIIIAENIPYEKALFLMIKSEEFSGLKIDLKSQRNYLTSINNDNIFSLSHIFGYVGKITEKEYSTLDKNQYSFIDQIGKVGLEYVYESDLKGTKGQKKIEVDAMGYEKFIVEEIPPINGKNLLLTIDTNYQVLLQKIIDKKLQTSNKTKAAGILMDPNNGDILTLVSYPYFDNNLFIQGISAQDYQKLINDENNPLFNRAISGEYPPGSTIKPMMAAAALNEKIITPYTTFNSTGGLRIKSWFFPDWSPTGHGRVNVTQSIAWSVNTFFYTIGGGYGDFQGLGLEKINFYLQNFGLGKPLGIDLIGESSGFLPNSDWKEKTKNEQWYIGDTYHLSIGQGDLLVTPLQVANWTAFFANGGTLYQPRLVKAKIDALGIQENLPKKILNNNFVSLESINTVRQGLRDTVTFGSGRSLNDLPVATAAKTGTAQWGIDKKPHAWFTVFAPYKNPEIVLTILVEEGEEGSKISLEIAKEFLQKYFSK